MGAENTGKMGQVVRSLWQAEQCERVCDPVHFSQSVLLYLTWSSCGIVHQCTVGQEVRIPWEVKMENNSHP